MKNQTKPQSGFTIIELTIATLVFSILLVICMTAFLNVGHLFIKGVNLTLVQQDTRNITDSITNDIRFSDSSPALAGMSADPAFFCVGKHRYKFALHHHLDSSNPEDVNEDVHRNYGLVRQDFAGNCTPPSSSDTDPLSGITNPVEMLSNNMQINLLQFVSSAGNACDNNVCTIKINVLFWSGDNTVFTHDVNDPNAVCKSAEAGSEFCATTSYTTTVLQKFFSGRVK